MIVFIACLTVAPDSLPFTSAIQLQSVTIASTDATANRALAGFTQLL